MKLLVINNLASGLGDGSIYDFVRAFTRDGEEVCLRSTDGTTDIAELVHDAENFDAVVASGGDGTVTAVNFLLANSGIPVLPFPAGTANLLTLNLKSPSEPHALADMVREGRILDFDLGQIEVAGRSIGFEMMAGAGYDAAIMRDAMATKKKMGEAAYFSAVFNNIKPPVSHFKVTLDGQTVESDGIGVLLVNFAELQYEISVTHENEPRDGKFDVVILKAQTAYDLIPALFAALRDRTRDYPDRTDALALYQASEVKVEADPPLEVQYDGEPTGLSTPFEAHVLPHAARMYVSDRGYEAFKD